MILSNWRNHVGRTLLMIGCVVGHDQSKSETNLAKFCLPKRTSELAILGFEFEDSQNVGLLAVRFPLTGALP